MPSEDARGNGQGERSQNISAKRRGTVACRRCRRLRSKCIHESTEPPCESCRQAGGPVAEECFFPARGDKEQDREFRAKRQRQESSDNGVQGLVFSPSLDHVGHSEHLGQTFPSPRTAQHNQATAEHLRLPPRGEIIEGCRMFTTSYFQLGFIPKALFLERLSRDDHAVSDFLLACILAISARFTPSLVVRYTSASSATSHFLDVASAAVPAEMYKPSLERVQAFFLLSIAQWGNGDNHRSMIHMSIAVSMATMLGLHREESYYLSPHATRDQIVESEVARRTFWMIQSQDNLHSGHQTPVLFSPKDITTLLPCDESDFAFGRIPRCRAALPDTLPALQDEEKVAPADRSLFATLVQAHNFWGIVARQACRGGTHSTSATQHPAEPNSEYSRLSTTLTDWESKLPAHHKWSVWNLRGYKAENLDLAYLAIVMVIRLSNIVLRRSYFEDIIQASHSSFDSNVFAHAEFWQQMSYDLFANVLELHEQIDAYFPLRLPEDGFPAVLAFCVYISGSAAAYLWRWPSLCPHIASEAESMAKQSLSILNVLQHAWPTASRWQKGLQHATTPGSDNQTSPIASTNGAGNSHVRTAQRERSLAAEPGQGLTAQQLASKNGMAHNSSRTLDDTSLNGRHFEAAAFGLPGADFGYVDTNVGAFEAELAALLQSDFGASLQDGWDLSGVL